MHYDLSRENIKSIVNREFTMTIYDKFNIILPQLYYHLINFVERNSKGDTFGDIFDDDQELIDLVIDYLKNNGWKVEQHESIEGDLDEYRYFKTIKISK
jgi:hypothetical protein